MSTQERGVYQPQEDFTTYEDYPEEEGRSRLPLMIVIALVVVAAFAGVVWLAYNQGVEHGRAGAPPIVAAPAGPARTAPDETQMASGQPGTPYTGLKIYGEPVPPDEEAANSALAPQPDTTTATQTAPVEATEEPTRLSAVDAAPAAEPAPIEVTPAPAPAPRAPVTVATAQPPQTTAPVPTPVAPSQTIATVPMPEATSPPPAPAPQVAIAPEPAPAAAHTGGVATSGKAVLQIGSFPTEALANAAWDKFRRGHAGTVTGLSSDVVAVQLPGKGTWYRLRIGPFTDRGAAASRCAQLKAQGATCLVAVP